MGANKFSTMSIFLVSVSDCFSIFQFKYDPDFSFQRVLVSVQDRQLPGFCSRSGCMLGNNPMDKVLIIKFPEFSGSRHLLWSYLPQVELLLSPCKL
jgi:hypothetical protein